MKIVNPTGIYRLETSLWVTGTVWDAASVLENLQERGQAGPSRVDRDSNPHPIISREWSIWLSGQGLGVSFEKAYLVCWKPLQKSLPGKVRWCLCVGYGAGWEEVREAWWGWSCHCDCVPQLCPTHTGQFSVPRITIVCIYTQGKLTKEPPFCLPKLSFKGSAC